MCSDLGSGSRCCALYSFTGILFTCWVGIMMHTQPFFIAGIEDSEHARSSAFGAMGMFIATFVVSVIGIYYDNSRKPEPLNGDSEAEYHLSHDQGTSYGSTN